MKTYVFSSRQFDGFPSVHAEGLFRSFIMSEGHFQSLSMSEGHIFGLLPCRSNIESEVHFPFFIRSGSLTVLRQMKSIFSVLHQVQQSDGPPSDKKYLFGS